MGMRGTDMAKEAADLILEDDRFRPSGRRWRRAGHLRQHPQFVFYLFSCNLAEIFVLLGAGFAGVGPPLLPLQILWSISSPTPSPRWHWRWSRAPRRDAAAAARSAEAILHGAMLWSIGMYAVLIAAVTIIAYANAGTTSVHDARARPGPAPRQRQKRRARARPRFAFANGPRSARSPCPRLQLLAAFLPPLAQVLRVGSLRLVSG